MARLHRSAPGAKPNSRSNEMKWLSGGLTFVNFATVCGLVIGMIVGGLSATVAWVTLILAAGFAILAYLRTTDPEPQVDALATDKSKI
jgi:hypothetical protein